MEATYTLRPPRGYVLAFSWKTVTSEPGNDMLCYQFRLQFTTKWCWWKSLV